MKFCFVSTMHVAPWGGSEELWSQTALRLHRAGHKVAAFVPWWPRLSPKLIALAEQGIEVCARKAPDQLPLVARACRKIRNRLAQTQEVAWLRRQTPDLVIISQGGNMDGLAWMTFCHLAGYPYVSVVQCNNDRWWQPDGVREEMVARYQAAKQVVCVSRGNLELLERQLGERLENASVVWNPFNVSTDPPPAWPSESDTWRLACVARLEPAAKGQDLLLQLLAQPLWRERAVEVNLYGGGRFEQGLKRLARNLPVKNYHFRGHVADVRKIWEENHLLVLPSRYEGLPLALVEAMWCGRPSVLTDVGGNAELCVDGETGFVAEAATLRLLEMVLERAWSQRHRWRSLGQAARARVEQLIPEDPVGVFCQQLERCARLGENLTSQLRVAVEC